MVGPQASSASVCQTLATAQPQGPSGTGYIVSGSVSSSPSAKFTFQQLYCLEQDEIEAPPSSRIYRLCQLKAKIPLITHTFIYASEIAKIVIEYLSRLVIGLMRFVEFLFDFAKYCTKQSMG